MILHGVRNQFAIEAFRIPQLECGNINQVLRQDNVFILIDFALVMFHQINPYILFSLINTYFDSIYTNKGMITYTIHTSQSDLLLLLNYKEKQVSVSTQ